MSCRYINIDFSDGTRVMINMDFIYVASFKVLDDDQYHVAIFCESGEFQNMLFSKADGEQLGKMIHDAEAHSRYAALTDLTPPAVQPQG
jgi:hypothetical protein